MKHTVKFIGLMLVGLVIIVVGAALAASNIPSTSEFGESTGSIGALLFGVFLAGVGQMVFLIGTIALGVFLGTRAANTANVERAYQRV